MAAIIAKGPTARISKPGPRIRASIKALCTGDTLAQTIAASEDAVARWDADNGSMQQPGNAPPVEQGEAPIAPPRVDPSSGRVRRL